MTQQIQLAKVASLTAKVRYPLGLADLEYALLGVDGQPTEPRQTVRLLLTSQEARQVGEQFLKIALAMEKLDGTKQ